MRPLRALVIYITVVFIGGALLAPWLFWLAQQFAHALPRIAGAPFHRFLDRSILILALAGLWPLLRALGATTWREIGITPPYSQWNKLGGGLLLGLGSLALVAAIATSFGEFRFAKTADAHKVVSTLFNAAGTALVVAVLEEILFRGGIYGGLRRVLYWPFALAASSAIYALVHFLQRADLAGAVGWNSGLVLLPRVLGGFTDFHMLVPGFFTLTLAGSLLGLAYQRTGNLYFSIGLHAGWIFVMKIFGTLAVQTPGAGTWFWGTAKIYDGWLAFLVLALALAASHFLLPAEKRPHFSLPR
jgi:membrane protease YdiL (CAAX protease family)